MQDRAKLGTYQYMHFREGFQSPQMAYLCRLFVQNKICKPGGGGWHKTVNVQQWGLGQLLFPSILNTIAVASTKGVYYPDPRPRSDDIPPRLTGASPTCPSSTQAKR